MTKTEHYHLNQWEPADRVLMTDFNEDNRKIDEALGAIQTQVAAKASQAELSALTVQLAKKGNCRIETGDYTMIVPGLVDSGKSVPVATGGNGYNSFSWSGNTLSWHNYDSASTQLNTEGRIYQYYAVYAN